MSIFQNKTWWSTKVGENEEFDPNHLCVCSINPKTPEDQVIIVGSFSGKIRVFKPQKRDFKLSDQLFAKDFKEPILQILCGRFAKQR